MNKKILFVFIMLISNIAYSQNDLEIQQNIKYSIEDFFSYVSGINDLEEQISINSIVGEFSNRGNYFYFNGTSSSLKQFLNTYINKYISTRLITHQLADIHISKAAKSENDKRYKVDATLKRSSATGEDIVIKDEKISMIVLWDGQCSILEINLSPTLVITHPIIRYEYTFNIDRPNSKYYINHEGGPWHLRINSRRQTIKEYSGYPQMKAIIKDEPWGFQITPGSISGQRNGNTLNGSVGPNPSKETQTFDLNLIQESSNKSITASIYQSAKPGVSRVYNFFEFNDDAPNQNVSLGYSLKYQMGLSYLYRFNDTRFSLGALLHVNFNSFKGLEYDYIESLTIESSSTIIVNGEVIKTNEYPYTYESNGYRITVDEVTPENEYSNLFDPHNSAKHFTARSLFMVQSGIYINDYLRFDLGLGAAAHKEKIHVDDVYKYMKYTYTPINEDSPQIDDIISSSWYASDYYFKGKYKWDFAIRTGINGGIPLNQYDDLYLNIGVGYVIVPNDKSCNSLDFKLGLGWYF